MCDQCASSEAEGLPMEHEIQFNKVINHMNDNDDYHCLSGPARVFLVGDKAVYLHWYINGQRFYVNSQEEFEKTVEYREWKLKAFK